MIQIPVGTAWVIAGALALFGGWVVILNYCGLFQVLVRHHFVSLIPLLGGLALGAATLVAPVPSIAPFCWLPLVLDPGSLYSVVLFVQAATRRNAFGKS